MISSHTLKTILAASAVAAVALLACTSRRGENFISVNPPEISGTSGAASAPRLVLPLEVDLPSAEAFVRIGFGLEPGKSFQATSFLTTRLRTIQAQPLVRLVKSYNDFNGENVAEALGRFRGRVSAIEFGRSGSPILFIELPHWTHQREETTAEGIGTRIGEDDHRALIAELRKVFVEDLRATAFTEEGRRVRVWWR